VLLSVQVAFYFDSRVLRHYIEGSDPPLGRPSMPLCTSGPFTPPRPPPCVDASDAEAPPTNSDEEEVEREEEAEGTEGRVSHVVRGWGVTRARRRRRVGDRGRARGLRAAADNFRAYEAIKADVEEKHKRTRCAWEKSDMYGEDEGGSSSATPITRSGMPKPPEYPSVLLWPRGVFLPGVPIYGGLPFSGFPVWAHPAWPLGGVGVDSSPAKKSRKLPRVWKGKVRLPMSHDCM